MTEMFYFLLVSLSTLFVYIAAETDQPWTEAAPGLAMDYRIHIDAGKEDCYYQYAHPGATLYTSMNVLKGGDGMAGFAVRNPQGEIVHPYAWKNDAEYEEVSKTGGYYALCIDNQFSKFSAKLVNLYITTFRHDLWEQFTAELDELNVHVANFTESLGSVDHRISVMMQHQSLSRAREARDYQLLMDNNIWVQYWSAGQCVALIATSIAQVMVLKSLLNNAGSGGRPGPRA